jgi:hypothetical protein
MKLRSKLIFFLLIGSLFAAAQREFSFPKEELRSSFSLLKYPEGLNKDSMLLEFEKLNKQQKIAWKKDDSLNFLYALIASDQFDEASKILKKGKKLIPRDLEELHLTQYFYSYKRRYKELRYWLDLEQTKYPEHKDIIKYRIRIQKVQEALVNQQWSTLDSVIFPELKNSKWKKTARGSKTYNGELIPMLKIIDSALRIETKYEFKSNVALALAFCEFGTFLKIHVSTTDAFIALAIAKFYDGFNPEITEKFREIRSTMNKQGLVFPSMRELFPKQSKGYFHITSIKKRQIQKADSMNNVNDNSIILKLDKKYNNFKINDITSFLIVFLGSIALLIYIWFYVKT